MSSGHFQSANKALRSKVSSMSSGHFHLRNFVASALSAWSQKNTATLSIPQVSIPLTKTSFRVEMALAKPTSWQVEWQSADKALRSKVSPISGGHFHLRKLLLPRFQLGRRKYCYAVHTTGVHSTYENKFSSGNGSTIANKFAGRTGNLQIKLCAAKGSLDPVGSFINKTLKDERMKIGIIAAMPEELKLLVERLGDKNQKQTRYGFIFHTGSIGRHEVVLVQSGIGKVLSALAVSLLVQLFEVDAIINTGSAGAIDASLKIGDTVLASRLAYHDVDVTAFGYSFGQMAGQPLYYESSKYFISELKKVLENPKVGLITSGDSFVASSEKIAAIKQHFPNALATEMEGASIAQAALAFSKPFVIIRAISDTADHQASVNFDTFIVEAGRQSAQVLIQLLENMV